jgi:isoamylase
VNSRTYLVFVMLMAWLPIPAISAIDENLLGARYNADGTKITFRLYSSRATRVELYIYRDPMDSEEIARYKLIRNPGTHVWQKSIKLSAIASKLDEQKTVYYGYRAWGPNWPYRLGWSKGSQKGFKQDVDAQGNRFNPNKLLLDPYAREISHDHLNPQWQDNSLFATGEQFRMLDSGLKSPKGIVLKPDVRATGGKPQGAQKDDVIYEVHLRGLTKNDPDVPVELQGTYAGAAMKAGQLASLGITAVEFLPVQETQNDNNNLVPNSTANSNYWGYMTINFFAPDRRYALDKSPGGPTREFKKMVEAFHQQGIKVYIDVVYNHTDEGSNWFGGDPNTYSIHSWRGLDNPTYYTLTADKGFTYDSTGVGGNFNTFNPVAQNVIVDSLDYWANTLGVDGFRFDLATVLGNICTEACFDFDKLNEGTALNRIFRELNPRPAAGGEGVDLIAEPWAPTGGDEYQLGNFPGGWSEWNDAFRNSLRSSQNQLGVTAVTPGQLANFFSGSSNIFESSGRKPWHSINFMVAHDGLTMKDLYSCNGANNLQPWPLGPSDGGTNDNKSWDQGSGGEPAQRQAARTGFAFLMLSAGVPMMTGGDEMLRSLNCNNNPYNLDSVANWLNYSLTPEQQIFRQFTTRLLAFRKAHPALRPADFYRGHDTNNNGMEQVRWFTPSGDLATTSFFNAPNERGLAYRIDGSEFNDPASAIYIAYNANDQLRNFSLPWAGVGKQWYRALDTAAWNEGNSVVLPGEGVLIGGEGIVYGVQGRSVVVLIAK